MKFCMLGASHCSFSTHNKKVNVIPHALYIAAGRNSAFTHHFIDKELLSSDQLRALMLEHHSKEEWVQLFHLLRSQPSVSEGDAVVDPRTKSSTLMSVIKTGKRVRSAFLDTPSSSWDRDQPGSILLDSEFDLVNMEATDLQDLPLEEKLNRLHHQWEILVENLNKMTGMLHRINSSHLTDLDCFEDKISSVDARIGSCTKASIGDNCITVWDGITFVHDALEALSSTLQTFQNSILSSIQEVSSKVDSNTINMEALGNELGQGLTDLANFVKTLNDEQTIISHRLSAGATQNLGTALNDNSHLIQELLQRVTQLESSAIQSRLGFPLESSTLGEDVNSLKIQIKLLESRLPTHNLLKLGGQMFQSRPDIALFVETKMPTNSFSMFHDVITLMERLSGSYIERTEVINEWYQATKVGLDECEARHVVSFKITYPTVFGYVKEGTSNAKHHLPAVKSFKEWNAFDAESGVKSFILNGMEDLKVQLYQDISSFFDTDQHYDARVLAHDMHSKSQIFVAEMCNWMDMFYQELLTTSEATEEEAWELVAACIKKVFEELRRARATAANAMSEVNASSKCATFMWALVQSHRIMKDFLDLRFRNHPSIAPVIILHIFKTRVTRVSYSTTIKRLEGRVAKLETTPAFKNPKISPKDAEGDKKGGKS